jgi:hypothetical protein
MGAIKQQRDVLQKEKKQGALEREKPKAPATQLTEKRAFANRQEPLTRSRL